MIDLFETKLTVRRKRGMDRWGERERERKSRRGREGWGVRGEVGMGRRGARARK